MEKTHRKHRVEVIVRKRQASGIATDEFEVVGHANLVGFLASLVEHSVRDVYPDDVRATLGEHRGEPTRTAGDLQDPPVFNRRESIENGSFFPPIDELSAL